jgi:hypothetical protein
MPTCARHSRAQAVSAARGRAKPAEPAVSAHQHDIEHAHGEIPVDALALRHVADAPTLRLRRFVPKIFTLPPASGTRAENRL